MLRMEEEKREKGRLRKKEEEENKKKEREEMKLGEERKKQGTNTRKKKKPYRPWWKLDSKGWQIKPNKRWRKEQEELLNKADKLALFMEKGKEKENTFEEFCEEFEKDIEELNP
ncbi:protein MNN4-like [Cucumis melo var. makuwa]|uniref:Protein MNN4-like n=1 Tax=Cucumis melo var. makuwa TaxID=1194695 RepID=A0A5D3E0Q1_CUCMM|nr:protein MNN4-like [Cucumis melo var. makuwa]